MEHALVYKDSEATTDVKPSMESPKLDETFKASPLVDELVNSVAAPVAIAVSEILHAKKGDNSASNTDQGSVVSDSINILISGGRKYICFSRLVRSVRKYNSIIRSVNFRIRSS